MYGIPDTLKPLSAAEEQVLLALWACKAPAARRDISDRLAQTGWKAATVLNFLYRLEEKGWVKRGKTGSCNTYSPTVTLRASPSIFLPADRGNSALWRLSSPFGPDGR